MIRIINFIITLFIGMFAIPYNLIFSVSFPSPDLMTISTKSSQGIDQFFAQNSLVSIIPKIKIKRLDLSDRSFGPFLVGRQIDVPLWFAKLLSNSDKCSVILPYCLQEEFLDQVYRHESENQNLLSSLLPNYFFEISDLFFKQ